MELRVAKIASIEFRHEFFAEPGFAWQTEWPATYTEDLLPKVKPTRKTATDLQNYGLLFRKSQRGFDIYSEVKKTGGKLMALYAGGKNVTFHFNVHSPTLSWPLFTRSLGAANGVAYFSNRFGLKPGGSSDLYLHNEVIASGAGTKEPATVVRKANTVYEALQRTTTQPPGASWAELGTGVDFTTMSNRLNVNRGSVFISEPDLKNAVIEIKDAYDQIALQKTFSATITEKEVSLDIKHLNEGVYSYHFNGTLRDTFFLAKNTEPSGFGILSIALQGAPDDLPLSHRLPEEWLPVANGTGVLQAGEINPRTFLIHFLQPTAKWRYAFSRDLAIPNSDIPSDFEKISNTIYQSKKAKALQRTSSGPDFGLNQNLPAPGIAMLGQELNGSQELEAFVSTTYVNV